MKINNIKIENVLGIQHVDLDLPLPVSLIAGFNGSGKTSIQQGIKLALTGELSRIDKKKHLKHLVHKGAKKGRITINTDLGDPRTFALPGGGSTGASTTSPALPFVLNPSLLASMKANDRRSFLFGLAGVKTTRSEINSLLEARGCDMALVGQLGAQLKLGYASANKAAAERATECKGAWKAATGETWGSQKGETWEDPLHNQVLPETEKELAEDIESRNVLLPNVALLNHKHGELVQKDKAFTNESTLLLDLTEKAAGWETLKATYDILIDQVNEQRAEVEGLLEKVKAPKPQSCPHCGESVIVVVGEIQRDEIGEATQATKDALEAAENDLAKLEGLAAIDLMVVEAAYRAHMELQDRPDVEEINQGDVEKCKGEIQALESTLSELNIKIAQKEELQRQITEAKENTANASGYHDQVLSWLKIAEAFAPDGIPGQLLAAALEPINNRLRDSSAATGWIQPWITADISIVASGRPYAFLSESEQWRVDTMLAEAISHISGLKLLLLDRFDVLDVPSRSKLIKWLSAVAKAGEIDTCLISATLKTQPIIPGITSYWLENGMVKSDMAVAS